MTLRNRIHELKTWPDPFQAAWIGDKTYEVRVNDRGFKTGDDIVLIEWDPRDNVYSGRNIIGTIRHITHGGNFGLPETLCVFSFDVEQRSEN